MFRVHKIVWGLICVALWGCAAPRAPQHSDFVPSSELLTVRIAREASQFFQQSRFVEAELRYRQVLYLSPQAQNMKRNLALTLVRLGNFEEAQVIYKQLLALEPESTELLLALAGLYYEQADFERAEASYKQALELETKAGHFDKAADIQRSLAVMQFKLGEEGEALCYSEQALGLSPVFAQSVRHARMLLALGRYAAANDLMQKLPLDAAERISLDFVVITSIAYFGMGQDRQAFERSDEFLRLQGQDLGSQPELRLLHYFVQDPKQRGEVSEDDQALIQSILRSDFLEQPTVLYLPPRLLREIVTATASLEPL